MIFLLAPLYTFLAWITKINNFRFNSHFEHISSSLDLITGNTILLNKNMLHKKIEYILNNTLL